MLYTINILSPSSREDVGSVVTDGPGLTEMVSLLERDGQLRYKVFQDGACLKPSIFGWDDEDFPGWLRKVEDWI